MHAWLRSRSGRGRALALLAGLLLATPVLGDASDPATPSQESAALLAREMAGVRRSLDHIGELLERLLAGQETDLLLRRIALKERRLDPVLDELTRLRRDHDDAEAEKGQMLAYLESLADEVTRGQLSGEDVAALQSEREQVENIVAAQEETLRSLETRIAEIENEVADARDDIEILEEILEERVGRR
jgi:chromosome segregation ATPase